MREEAACLAGQMTQRSPRRTWTTGPCLVDLAFRMLGDVGAAEDAVQDAFARLVRCRARRHRG